MTGLHNTPAPGRPRRFTEDELAERWRISPRTPERWRLEGRGPNWIRLPGRVIYREEDVLTYEDAHLRGG